MKATRTAMALLAVLCLAQTARAQYDETDEVEEWTLDLDEEETPKPQHKEYKNALYLQYSASQYKPGEDASRFHMNEMAVGYFRSIQVVEEKPYFVEAGANLQFSWETSHLKARLLTFRVPINVVYKIYPWRDKDFAIAPFAGASLRAIAMARERTAQHSTNLLADGGWKSFQVAWQVGLRFSLQHYFLGVSYSRDFRDSSKFPGIRQCSVQLGYCF